MKKSDSTNKISDEAIMERAFSYCNEAMHTISLQCRRLQSTEPEDSKFVFRQWADLRFLILSLDRLDRSVKLARKISSLPSEIDKSISKFNNSIPSLKKFRNVGEHFEEYALDSGFDKSVSRRQLQVGLWDGITFEWLDEKLNVVDAQNAAIELFKTIQKIKNNFLRKNQ